MTWIDLAKKIDSFTEEQKNTDVSVFYRPLKEFYPVDDVDFSNEESKYPCVVDNLGVLDDDHPFLMVF